MIHALSPTCPLIEQNPDKNTERLTSCDINNLTSIRLPYSEHFRIIDPNGTFLVVSNQSIKNKKNIEVSSQDELVLLYASQIPSITILQNESTPLPWIISMIPGKATHVIGEIYAPNHSFIDIINTFFACEKLEVSKLFYIEKLTCLNQSTQKLATYQDVMVFNAFKSKYQSNARKKWNGIIFTLNNKLYKALWHYKKSFPENLEERFKLSSGTETIIEQLESYFHDSNVFENMAQSQLPISLEAICKSYV